MAKCSNCSKTMSCGCQKRTASDGKAVCSSCLTSYEQTLKPTKTPNEPVVKNTSLWGANRYKNLEKFIKK